MSPPRFPDSHETGDHKGTQGLGARQCHPWQRGNQAQQGRCYFLATRRYYFCFFFKLDFLNSICLIHMKNYTHWSILILYIYTYTLTHTPKHTIKKVPPIKPTHHTKPHPHSTNNHTPQTGVYVHGLYLDGAGWDKKNARLISPSPKVLYTLLPVVHIFAVNFEKKRSNNFSQVPVYKKAQRTDLTYIFPLMLKTNLDPNHWITRGVALLCDIKWFHAMAEGKVLCEKVIVLVKFKFGF